ncbi:MAG: response regulator [Betaproteobacteria bacterium]|nr:response regulator [Betaproteobacteria bacterium]
MVNYNQVEILLAEDNPRDAEMTMRALRKINFINKVHWVKDGEEAMSYLLRTGEYADRAASDAPKLVLLDIKMPRMDGIEVLRRIKSDKLLQGIPVVVMTSSNEERDVFERYRLGVNSYIVKPVEFASFVETVAKVGLYWILTNRAPQVTGDENLA